MKRRWEPVGFYLFANHNRTRATYSIAAMDCARNCLVGPRSMRYLDWTRSYYGNPKQYRSTLQVPRSIGKGRPTDLYRSIYRHILSIYQQQPWNILTSPYNLLLVLRYIVQPLRMADLQLSIVIMDVRTFICHLYVQPQVQMVCSNPSISDCLSATSSLLTTYFPQHLRGW